MIKRENQIISFVLVCILLLLTPGTDVFAANEGCNNEVEEGYELIDAADTYELLLDTNEITSSSTASGSYRLSGGSTTMVKLGALLKGTTVKYKVTWTIASFPIYVGLYQSGESTVTTTLATGGSKTFTQTISTVGTYYIYIYNPNSSGIDLNLTCTVTT